MHNDGFGLALEERYNNSTPCLPLFSLSWTKWRI